MARFLTGSDLNAEIEALFENAEEQIIIISPYIKLHERYKSSLRTKLNNPELEIVIVFGKNEEDKSRSMQQVDFDFFKQFPNIEIRYEKRLHAKYYANESSAILSSMNLYSYSQDNNIETGVLTEATLLGDFASKVWSGDSLDVESWKYFTRVIDQSDLLFEKKPVYENSILGLRKTYKTSSVEKDELSTFFAGKYNFVKTDQKAETSQENKTKISKSGFCIRTGIEIPFNHLKPMCDEAFEIWSKHGNEDYRENYCHFSGEKSNGETTKAKPILRKNWLKAKEIHRF